MNLDWKHYFLYCALLLVPLAGYPVEHLDKASTEEGYTINYTTISIVEYIRFASKICKVNFLFDEEDLPFTVTVVSEGPITPENVMATLLQTLRIHGLTLLEQDNNLVIHKSGAVHQIAELVTEDGKNHRNSPIVTRIFRLNNASPESISAVVRPMISESALLEVSPETRQLILTDITANVDKIAALIENLDSPHTTLEISQFEVQFNKADYLIGIASQIMHPLTQGTPFILVPQLLANSIFLVSTPALNEKALSVLASLDTEPKLNPQEMKGQGPESAFIYKAQHRRAEDLLQDLQGVQKKLKEAGIPQSDLAYAIETAKSIPHTNTLLFIGSTETNEKLREFLSALDNPSKSTGTGPSFFIYKPKYKDAAQIEKSMRELAENLASSKGSDEELVAIIRSSKVNTLTHTLLFSGDSSLFGKVQELIATFDLPSAGEETSGESSGEFFVYKLQKASESQIRASLKSFAKSLEKSGAPKQGLIEAIGHMKYLRETNSILFTANGSTLKKLQELVPQFDQDTQVGSLPVSSQFFIYKPHYHKGEQLEQSIRDIAHNLSASKLADPAFLNALGSMKWIDNTNSLLFTGDPASLKKVEELLPTLDYPRSGAQSIEGTDFFLYRPQHVSRQTAEAYFKKLAELLPKKGDLLPLDTLHSFKWIEPSRSFLFQGTEASLARLKDLLKEFDTPSSTSTLDRNFFLYPMKTVNKDTLVQYLDQIASNLQKKGTDPELVEALRSRQWVEESHSFMFSGPESSLVKVRDLLSTFDTKSHAKAGYFIYKLQHASAEKVEEELEGLVKKMQASGLHNTPLFTLIENMRYVKETNSLLLTGDPTAIEEAKELIEKYDYPRDAKPEAQNTSFYLYKPVHASAVAIEKSLRDIRTSLKKSELSDPTLLSAIDSMKYVETTNSLIFTGSPDALQKVQVLIQEIDVPAQKIPIQHIGKTTFLLYKLKNSSPSQITSSLQMIAADLKKSGAGDKEFLSALSSVKYIKETHSLMFSGTEEALTRVQGLVEKFDIAGPSSGEKPIQPPTPGATDFFVYKPQAVAGPDLEKTLSDFAENLRSSGLNDPGLFSVVASMKWIEKTSSLVFTGDPKSLAKVKELLKEFDIPPQVSDGGLPFEPSIQSIDNTSFLVYKLQYHKGDQVQNALRQIGKDLVSSNAPVDQTLLNSINSIQWLEITNSLLCTGSQETLTRLRELIKNLDAPLKQVFIEMLILQTSLTNSLNFGLQWAGQVQYRNKFAGNISNVAPPANSSDALPGFFTNLSRKNATTPPTPADIPIAQNFELGVIGEIIKHNGQTFVTLGSLFNALQQDTETTIVMTPKIISQDGHTSSIFVGQNIPFVGSFVSNTSNNTVSTSNIEYRDVGLSLVITPVLGNGEIITLDIRLDQSSSLGSSSGATFNFPNNQSASGIVTSKTTMETTVHVPNNNFLILSGMVNNSNIKSRAGIPCLGGLPLVGAAFSQDNDLDTNNSLVIFLRPTIINSLAEMMELTKRQEDFFYDQTGTPRLENNFEENMELIKGMCDD